MAQAVDALGYIHPVAVGQCCAAWSWSIGATSLARLAIMMMMILYNISGIASNSIIALNFRNSFNISGIAYCTSLCVL